MGLTKLAIARPIAILALISSALILGILSYFNMPAELNPQVDFPAVTISTTYAGTSPQEMETLITKPIEDSISGVSGIQHITSTSVTGASIIVVQFYFGTDINSASSDVIQKVDAIRKSLPTDADSPAVLKMDTSSTPIMNYSMVSTQRSAKELRSIADTMVKPFIEEAPSVGSVTISGGDVREIRIGARADRLEAYGITVSQLATALINANVNMATGFIQRGQQYFTVHLNGEFASVDEIRNLRLYVGNTAFYVKDVANVTDTFQEKTSDSFVNDQAAVSFTVLKTSQGNTIQAADGVKKQVINLQKQLPKDIKFLLVSDQSKIVRSNLGDVDTSLALGALMAVLVVYIFLHNIRGTIIIAIAIPTSIIATFLPIKSLGFTLNSMTLLGLSLAVGILVDDAIVVLENINRHLALGEEPQVAAINGRGEIALAAITLTSVDLVVFLPIAFMGGVVGEFFKSFGTTVAIATLFSLFVSFTVTPMLAARWYRKGESHHYTTGFAGAFDRGFKKFEGFYRSILSRTVRHPYIVVSCGVVALVLTMVLVAPRLGFRFAPGQDQNQVAILVEGPDGASLNYTKHITDQIEAAITSTPDLKRDVQFLFTTLGSTGSGGGGGINAFTGTQYANVGLQLYDRKSVLDNFKPSTGEHLRPRSDVAVAEEIRKKVANIVGAKIITSEVSGFGGGTAPLQIRLSGLKNAEILAAATKIYNLVANTPGVVEPDISYKNTEPEVQIRIDRTKAPEFGLTSETIASAVSIAMQGDTTTQYRDPADGQQYNIRVQMAETDRADPAQVGNIVVGYQNSAPIHLSQVADITLGVGPVKVDRYDRERQVVVSSYLKTGYEVGNVSTALMGKIRKMDLGTVEVSAGGEAQRLGEEGGYMLQAVVLGILLSYMLMAALFNNVLYPLSIMFSLPQAWVGAMIALLIAHMPFSLIGVIGIVMLDGVVQKNAILLVDYTNTMRRRGYKRIDALLEAGPIRLRPILMTTLAIVVSTLPTALALGRGAGFRQSLGIVVIGGVSLSLLLTLLIIPSAYVVWDDIGNLVYGLMHRSNNRSKDVPPGAQPFHAADAPTNGDGDGNGNGRHAASNGQSHTPAATPPEEDPV
ncbi:MAG: efflux RND transporter permease subunit [Capsulimonadaceae bacterium]|nr:efflux RND transporter permease subunit [Capsulimonadaceae bacterium]